MSERCGRCYGEGGAYSIRCGGCGGTGRVTPVIKARQLAPPDQRHIWRHSSSSRRSHVFNCRLCDSMFVMGASILQLWHPGRDLDRFERILPRGSCSGRRPL